MVKKRPRVDAGADAEAYVPQSERDKGGAAVATGTEAVQSTAAADSKKRRKKSKAKVAAVGGGTGARRDSTSASSGGTDGNGRAGGTADDSASQPSAERIGATSGQAVSRSTGESVAVGDTAKSKKAKKKEKKKKKERSADAESGPNDDMLASEVSKFLDENWNVDTDSDIDDDVVGDLSDDN